MPAQVRKPGEARPTQEALPPPPASSPAPSPRHSRKAAALRTVDRWLPVGVPPVAGAPVTTATELWVGVHFSTDVPDLERLAVRAQRFSPRVSLAPPDGLLLEVKGSLHLFNGVEGLCRALTNECALLGLKPRLALSPTPLSALVAARAGKAFVVLGLAQLVSQLAALPLTTLRWSEDTLERLAHMGVRTIGQVLRLPRAGFARRFGAEHLSTLDRLVGRDADLRDRFHARERFRRKRDLTYELESHDRILATLDPLFAELGKFLLARQCGISLLECRLRHRHAPPTSCVLRLAAPVSDVDRLRELLGERLNALVLPEPVRSCELRSGALVRSVFASNALWQPGEHGGSAEVKSPELIERLRARLGPEAVYGLKVLPGHRPENAWGVVEPVGATERPSQACHPGNAPGAIAGDHPWCDIPAPPSMAGRSGLCPSPFGPRPAWLLPAPQLLLERGGLPRHRGALRLLGDPERIETGWWDGGEVARDYYVAVSIHGVRLWVFRERHSPHQWFLHGVFG